MFRQNKMHTQESLFSTVSSLPKSLVDSLKSSWAAVFYKHVFCKIDERKFAVLFSDKKSRSNFPVNIYVGLEILKWLFDWSDEEMLENYHFNLKVCYAFGIKQLGQRTVAPRTIYYHRKRILAYEQASGVNLFDEMFREITSEQIRALGIKTSIQRMDSSQISSAIKRMSRLEIVIKVLQNFFASLSEADRQHHYDKVKAYISEEAGNLTYRLKNSKIDEHLKEVGELILYFHTLYQQDSRHNGHKSFTHLKRVLDEQYTISDGVVPKPTAAIATDSLQNPADDEATYSRKYNRDHRGYVLNVAETCDPGNSTQLLTDISSHPNNTSDEEILKQRIAIINEQSKLDELVVDGSYSGKDSEESCQKQHVELIFTGIKGPKQNSERIALHHFKFKENAISACPEGHDPIAQRFNNKSNRYIVHFDKELCLRCPLRQRCCVQDRESSTVLYYTPRHLLVSKRRRRFTEQDYQFKQKLRPAIEGTISLFKRRTYNGKLRVRGFKKVRNAVILTAIAINFRRIVSLTLDSLLILKYFLARLRCLCKYQIHAPNNAVL